uniref:Uncharacterized protein n=1 Tax=Populus trichocarpa TaxID=3694 RepID=A0A2K1XIQ8_POPTR
MKSGTISSENLLLIAKIKYRIFTMLEIVIVTFRCCISSDIIQISYSRDCSSLKCHSKVMLISHERLICFS